MMESSRAEQCFDLLSSLLGCLGIVLGQRKVFLLNLEYSKASFYSSVTVLVSRGFPIGSACSSSGA